MANYYGSARSNYFKVKDIDKFEKEFIGKFSSLQLIKKNDLVGFLVDDDYGGIPFTTTDESGEEIDVDFDQDLAAHLEEGSVAIYQECGAEKLRYLTGYAMAVNSKGETRSVSIGQIYQLAKELTTENVEITPCEY